MFLKYYRINHLTAFKRFWYSEILLDSKLAIAEDKPENQKKQNQINAAETDRFAPSKLKRIRPIDYQALL
jgi:hypothetical protein